MPCTEKAWGRQILIRDDFWQCWVLLCHGGLVTLFSRWQLKCKRLWAATQIDLSEILLHSSLGACALFFQRASHRSKHQSSWGRAFLYQFRLELHPQQWEQLFFSTRAFTASVLWAHNWGWLFALVINSDMELNAPLSTQESEKPGCRHSTHLRKGLVMQMQWTQLPSSQQGQI